VTILKFKHIKWISIGLTLSESNNHMTSVQQCGSICFWIKYVISYSSQSKIL